MTARNEAILDSPVPEDILTTLDPDRLNRHLAQFVVETRKTKGELYPPASLHQLPYRLLRHMAREVNPSCPNFLDKKDKPQQKS